MVSEPSPYDYRLERILISSLIVEPAGRNVTRRDLSVVIVRRGRRAVDMRESDPRKL